MEESKVREIIDPFTDGAVKVFKDGKSRKGSAHFGNPLGKRSLSYSSENLKNNKTPSSKACQVNGECSFKEKREEFDSVLQETKRVCEKLDMDNVTIESSKDQFDDWNKEYFDVSKEIDSSFRAYSEFPLLNFLAFLAVLAIKFVSFQFNLLVSFLTFPIWFSYFLFTFFMCPFHTLRHVKVYLMKKLLKILGSTSKSVTVKAQKSVRGMAVRFSCAFFWSVYVYFMLLGLLASGFVFEGFVISCLVENPVQITETLNFDYTKTSPVAFVPVASSPGIVNPSGIIVKDNGKHVGARVIPYNHKLHLTVSLKVPESEYNRKLGVFQVRVEFLSATGKVTASSSYPCMLHFKSKPIRLVETIIKTAPLLAGIQSESQILNIKMSEFSEGLEPTACFKVILEQRAEYRPGAGIPEIYAASLALESELPQLKRMIWNWRRTIFVWSSILWFLTVLVIILLFCRLMVMPKGRPRIVYGEKGSRLKIISWYKCI